MALPITIPNTFANANAAIPLSQLDNNFSTVVVAVNGIGNGSEALSNVNITGGQANVTFVSLSNGNASSPSMRFTSDPNTGFYNFAADVIGFAENGSGYKVGFRNVPPVGTKTGSYTLQTTDVGEYVQVGTGGSITIPDATFAEGDVISIFNNTSGSITVTCSITTAYIAGTDSDKATVSLATRGVATILFISSTVCVISGNVS
jgi:hypothetical protein